MKKVTTIVLIAITGAINSQNIPNLEWAQSFGNTNYDESYSMAVDNNNNIYSCGRFSGTVDFDNSANTYTLTSSSSDNGFIMKTDDNGNFIWAKSLLGILGNKANSITTDQQGNVYIAGTFKGTVDFDPSLTASYNLSSNNNTDDAFVLKLDANGDFVWARQVGGTNTDNALSIAVDANQNVYYSGIFVGTVDFDPGAGVSSQSTIGTNKAYFFSKLNSNGNFVWAHQIRTSITGSGYTVKLQIDENENLTAAGSFEGTVDFDPSSNTYNVVSSGSGKNLFVLKLNSAGNFLWAKGIPGYMETINPRKYMSIDDAGYIYATGRFTGTVDFDPGPGTYTVASSGSLSNINSYIIKLTTNGDFVWVKTIGGSGFGGQGLVNSISIHADKGKIYNVGFFRSTIDFDATPTTYTIASSSNMSSDCYVLKYDTSGNFIYSFAMSGNLKMNTLETDGNENLYITGSHSGTNDFDPSSGTYSLSSQGTDDCFLFKLNSGTITNIMQVKNNSIQITCAPNPANQFIQIKGIDFNEGVHLKIISIDGKIMKDCVVNESNINVSELTPGMYFIEFKDKKGKTGVTKFIKE
jgi:hypothetical protein